MVFRERTGVGGVWEFGLAIVDCGAFDTQALRGTFKWAVGQNILELQGQA